MKTVQMTLNEELVKEVDKLVKKLHTTRSAFTRIALQRAIQHNKDSLLEEKHRNGYKKYPAKEKELKGWEAEQEWGDK